MLQSCPVSDRRRWRGVSCPGEEKLRGFFGGGGPCCGGGSGERERRDGKDRNGRRGHNV